MGKKDFMVKFDFLFSCVFNGIRNGWFSKLFRVRIYLRFWEMIIYFFKIVKNWNFKWCGFVV